MLLIIRGKSQRIFLLIYKPYKNLQKQRLILVKFMKKAIALTKILKKLVNIIRQQQKKEA